MSLIPKIWITGAYGRLGAALKQRLDRRAFEIFDTDLDDVDVTKVDEVQRFADRTHPDIIIHCAGMTDTRACENDPERAFLVNALGARNVAIAARRVGARLVHISTDDVFGDGFGLPYNEFDHPSPTTVYGRSKLAGEDFVRTLAPKQIIVRSGWVYGTGENFVSWLLHATESGKPIPVANDQTGSPTSAARLADAVIVLMQTSEYGLYHAVCEGSCTRYEFAQEILRLCKMKAKLVPCSSRELQYGLSRPAYTVLDNFMLRVSGLHQMCGWKEALAEYFDTGA